MKHFERILKTTGIIKASPEDQLSATLAHLSSSHDAAFVFDDKKHFIGVINPYYSLIRSSNPGKTKVENCLFHPPHVTQHDSLDRIARLMSESKIHYLPVFNEKKEFVGITSARRILHVMQEIEKINALKVQEILNGKNAKVISIYEDATIGEAMNLFKEHKVSKLVMIDKNMKLKGILSYYDLIPYLVAPGVSKSGGRGHDSHKDKDKLMGMKVKNYAKTTTMSMSPQDTIGAVIDCILKKKRGSVVIIDAESHPVGILTTRDIFTLLEKDDTQKPLIVSTKNLAEEHTRLIADFTNQLQEYLQHDKELQSGRLVVSEERNGGLYSFHVTLTPHKGSGELIKREGKDIHAVLGEIREALKALNRE